MGKVNLGLRGEIKTKMSLMLLWLTMKGVMIQNVKPNFSNCGKKYFGKCLADTSGCYGCGNNNHKVRDCPIIGARGRDAHKAPYSDPDVGE